MKFSLRGLLLLSLCAPGLATAELPTPSRVLSHIAAVGPAQAVLDYYETPQWTRLIRGVASGEHGWLQVYAALLPSADAAAGEDLGDALLEALAQSPFEVLTLLATDVGGSTAQQLCTLTFESKLPSGGIAAYLNRLEQALAKANSRQKRALARSCRLGIEATKRSLDLN